MAEDRVGVILSRVEQSVPPDEDFGEGLFATLALQLENATSSDLTGQILSRVEQSAPPDEAFAERLYATLAIQLEAESDARRGGAFLLAIRSIADRARFGLDAFRLQAAVASALVVAMGILALFVIPSPLRAPQERTPLAGPSGKVGDSTSVPNFPSTAPNGCVCVTPESPARSRQRSGVSASLERGQLPSSAATQQIAFARVSDSPEARFQIFTMNLDGTNLRRVTHDDTSDYRQPSWSPDRKRLVFTRTAARDPVLEGADPGGRGTARFGEIFVANADGSDMRKIADGGSPEWSPDGSLIVYHGDDPNPPPGTVPGPSIWTMKPDGTNAKMLTDSGTNGTDATWSPDGNYIAFGSLMRQSQFPNVPNGAVNEFRMRADGTDIRQLTADPVLACFGDWSPDGTHIAYTSQLNVYTRLMLMKADGSGHHQITHEDVSNVAPAWSPDGSLIAFEHAPRGDNFYIARPADPNGEPSSIWVMKPDGSLRKRISPADGWNYFDPVFAP